MARPRPQRAMPPRVFCAGSKKSRSDGTGSCIDRWRDAAVMPGVEAQVSYPASTASVESAHTWTHLRGRTEPSVSSSVIRVFCPIAIHDCRAVCHRHRQVIRGMCAGSGRQIRAVPSTARFLTPPSVGAPRGLSTPGTSGIYGYGGAAQMKISKLPLPNTYLTAKELT